MSAQSAKKKRIGSRRRAATQNKTSEGDELHVTDSTAVAENCIPEENTESLNVLANPDNSQTETQNPASPELTGNRRKLGSSRRSKGGQRVKDSPTESYHKPREEAEEKTRGNETTESTQMSLAIQSQRQEDTVSAINDSSLYSAFTPDISSEVQYSATTICPEADLESLIPKDENLQVDQDDNETDYNVVSESNSREMPEEEHPNVYLVTEKESKDREEDTELLGQDGKLQGNYLVSDSHAESVVKHFSTTPDITTDKSSPRENTELEYSVEEAVFSSPNKDLTKEEEQNEHFNFSEVKGPLHLEEVKPTQMHEIDHSSESVTHDATEDSEITSRNLIDKAAVSDTNQSELIVKSSDDSATRQEDLNPDDKQDEHPAKENNIETLESTKIQTQLDNIERVDTALGQVYEGEGQVEDDIKPSAEQVHQEKEEILYEDERYSCLHTLQSETNAPLDSQHLDNAVTMEEHTHTDFSPFGNRRKLGSSRRNKGLQHVKESVPESYHECKAEVVEITRSNEALEATQMSVAIERTNQEELSQGSEHDVIMPATHDSSLYSAIIPDYSSEVQNPTTTNYPEADLEIPKSEALQEDHDERKTDFTVEVPDKSVGATLEGMDKSDTLQSQEVRGVHRSEDVHEQMYEIDHSSESVTHDTTENSEIISGNLINQTEVSDTDQSELIVEKSDFSATKQEDSNPDDKDDEHPTKESFESFEHQNEDYHVYETKIPPIDNIKGGDTALSQVYESESRVDDEIKPSAEQTCHQEKEGVFPEMEKSESSLHTLQSETNAPLDSKPQDNSVRIEEQTHTDLNPIGNRIISGNLIDQTEVSDTDQSEVMVEKSDFSATKQEDSNPDDKDDEHPTEENFESFEHQNEDYHVYDTELPQINNIKRGDAALGQAYEGEGRIEDDMKPSAEQTCHQEEEGVFSEMEKNESTLHSLQSETNAPLDSQPPLETSKMSLTVETAVEEKSMETMLEGMEKFDTVQIEEVNDEVKVHEQEVSPRQMHEIDHSAESVTMETTESSEIISGNLIDQTEVSDTDQSELIVRNSDDSATKQEDSNPDDKEDEHPTKENSFEALEQTNDDYHVYGTKKLQISGIERVDSALGEVYEIEGQVEDDIKPSAEQVHQEKEEVISEMEESRSSLQTLQSEMNAPLDSQPQQSDTGFNPIGNRRKLGSSRRSKGRQHAKDSAAESYHRPTEEVDGNTRINEPLETTKMSLTIETTVEEKSMETMLEGMEKFDTAQMEEVNDQVKENALVGISELTTSSLHSSITADQQLIDQSNSTEMPEELPKVYSVEQEQNKDGDEDTESLRQDGNLQDNYLLSETPLRSEDMESSITQEMTTEKRSPREHTDPECSVEEAKVSTPNEELPTNDQQNYIFSLSEVKGAYHLENAVHNIHEGEIKPTQMHDINFSSESVTHDTTENSEIISGNLINQAEVSDTDQSELIVEKSDFSATKQEDSNPDDKDDEHPTKENLESFEHQNEDYHVCETKIPPIDNIEGGDTALSQVYESESRVDDEIKPSAEQTCHQEKEGVFPEMEKSESSLHTLQSETNAPLDSQPQDNSVRIEEQTHTDFNPIGNRRKLGSSRRSKGRRQVKESVAESYHEHKVEVVESTRDNEAPETRQMLVAIERQSHDELTQGSEHDVIMPATHDSSLYSANMPDYSSEVRNPTTTNCPEADLESLIPKSEPLQEDHDERKTDFTVEVPDKSVGATLEGMDKSDTLQSQEVRGAHHSEDAINKVHEQEVKPTQMHEIDHSSESVINDNTGNSEIISGNLIDQTEVSDTDQSELIVKNSDDSATKQEDSNPDDKEDEHPTKENSFEALEQTNDDYHVYDTKKLQISGIERVDSALGEVYEIEGQVEDDIKPSAEQVHQEKEEVISEMEESRSSLQTLQSEMNAPLDSQPQQSDTGFNPIGNRRKLGSSRRSKGRQHAKDSAAESYHRPTEEVDGNTRINEPLETTKMSLTVETTVEEKSMETMLEGMEKFDTAQTEEVNDQVKENALVGISELTTSSLHSSITADQQLIDQSNSTEMPEEELPNVYSVEQEQKKDGDEDTESLRQDGNLQDNYLLSETPLRSEDMESSITQEMTTEKRSPREHTDPECSVEEAIVSTPNEELPTNDQQNYIFSLSEVKGAYHLENAVHNIHEGEIKPTQMHDINFSSESVTHDTTENSEIISGNLINQAEVSDTDQSELIVEKSDFSATKQEDSNPDDKDDEHPTKENLESFEHQNEDYHVCETKIPPTDNIEGGDTALSQVYESESRVDDEIKPSAEQTCHQEKEGVFPEMEKSESSLHTLHSETNAPLDSQPQDNSVRIEEQTHTDFNPIGNRRKLGSSRRSKGRRQVKESVAESYHEHKVEVVESTRDNEAPETRQMLVAIERLSHDELTQGSEHDVIMPATHDSSLYSANMPDYSSEVRNPTTTNCPEADLESLIPKSEPLQEDHDERKTDFTVEVPDKSVGATLEGMDKSDTLQSQEVRGAHHSEDAINKVHEQEVKPTQMHEIDHSSESVINDNTGNSEIISGNLIDQTEVSDTDQSELIVKNSDDSATKQEDSNPDDKEDEHPTKENSFEALEQTNDDYHVYDTKKLQISGIERVDSALGEVYEIEGQVEDDIKPSAEQVHQEKEEVISEMEESRSSLQTLQSEMNAPLDSQPQQSDTGFNPIGNRRKLGSSRRSKGRQRAKDSAAESYHRPTEEVDGNTRINEPLETTKMSLTIEKTVEEKSMETMLEGMGKFDTAQMEEVNDQVKENALGGISELTTSSLHSSITADQQLIDQSNSTEVPEEELPNVYSVEQEQKKDGDEDTESLRQDGNLQDNYVSHLKLEDVESSITQEMTTEKLSTREHTDPECSVEEAKVSTPNKEVSANEAQKEQVNLSQVRGAVHSEDTVNEVHAEEGKSTQMKEMHQIDFSSIKEGECSLQSEMNAPLDSQPLDNSLTIEEQTHTSFNPIGNRRKLGSSRRNKGRQHVKDSATETYHKPKEEFVDATSGGEGSETSATEKTRQEKLNGQIRKIRSAVNEEENTEKMPEEETILSHIVMDNSTSVTTNIASSSDKDDPVISHKDGSEEENNPIKEPENLIQVTGYDTVKMDLMQSPEVSVWRDDSDIQNISHHNDSVTARSITSCVLEQEDAYQVQKTEALFCNKDSLGQEINMQGTNGAIETEGGVNIDDCNTEAESLTDVQAHNRTDTSAPFDIEENFRAEREESEMSSAVGAYNNEQGIQEKTHLDNKENLHGKSKQKRRKMGSTRHTRLNKKPEEGMDNTDETKESDVNMEADMKNVGKMEVVEELPMIVKPSLNPLYKEQQESNETSAEVVNPVVADIRDSEGNVGVNVEPSQLDDFTGTELHLTSVLAGRNSCSIDPSLSSNTVEATNTGSTGGSFVSLCETTQSTENDEERPESVNVIQDQALKSAEASMVAVADLEIVQSVVRGGAGEEHKDAQVSIQEPNNVNEGAHNENVEMKNAGPNLNSPKRRRKMGSTRKNLGSRSKREDFYQKQEVDNEATEAATDVGDVKAESFPGLKEKEEPRLHIEDKDSDSEQRKEKVNETVEYSHTGESHFSPPSHQAFEENPDSHGQLVNTEPQLTPSYSPATPPPSPKHDVMSETAGGRRRKLGSNRKSRGHQNNDDLAARGDKVTDTQNERDVRSAIDESDIKTTEEESLDKLSEVHETINKPPSNISTSKAGEPSRPVSEKTPQRVTPVQHPFAEVRLGQESQKTFSLGSSSGAAQRPNSYNVMMVGDSSVGKTSFMKRAQSGKFSLDLPASVGLDSCMWNVVVDGKPVVLQLWDTAGQERFHSMTRQIFYKAQAFLLMYDITSSQSFSAVSYWANCIQEGAAENVTILLLGNKSDHAERQVTTQEGEALAEEYNVEFMECSAATGENVIQSLETIARMLSQKFDTREETTVLHKEPQQKKSSGCC